MKEIAFWFGSTLALLALVAGILFAIMWGTVKLNESYLKECRDRGGVPVSTGRGSYNCANPNGGWIDV